MDRITGCTALDYRLISTDRLGPAVAGNGQRPTPPTLTILLILLSCRQVFQSRNPVNKGCWELSRGSKLHPLVALVAPDANLATETRRHRENLCLRVSVG